MVGVLTESSKVVCAHNGAVSTEGSGKLVVAGGKVLQKSGVAGKSISATCSTVPAADASGTPTDVKCTTVSAVSAGEATKLFVEGRPALLDSSLAGTTNGMVAKATPQALGTAAAQQSKLTAI
jgi:hypothetical protein